MKIKDNNFELELDFLKKSKNLRNPLYIAIPVFAGLFLAFSGLYAWVSYHSYLKEYQFTQSSEIGEAKHKSDQILKDINKLLKLIETRIRVADGDLNRIQAILASSTSLSTPLIPPIKKLSYYKLSGTAAVVSRFGVNPLPPSGQMSQDYSSSKDKMFHFDEDNLYGGMRIFDDKAQFVGVLEVQIDLNEFHKALGQFQTIVFSGEQPPSHSPDKYAPSEELKHVYLKLAPVGWQYVVANKNYICFMGFCLSICLVMAAFFLYFFKRYYGTHYEDQITSLTKIANETLVQKNKLEVSALHQENEEYFRDMSRQSQKKFYTAYLSHQRSQISNLAKSLSVLEHSLVDSFLDDDGDTQLTLLQTCRSEALSLSKGTIGIIKNESVDLRAVLDDIPLFFADKLHKSSAELDINCEEGIGFDGDPIFTQFILLNFIGKAIYRAQKGGKIFISASQKEREVSLIIKEHGFLAASSSEKLIQKSLDFFVSDTILVNLCKDLGLVCEQFKEEDNSNAVKIVFSNYQEEDVVCENVVQLFK